MFSSYARIALRQCGCHLMKRTCTSEAVSSTTQNLRTVPVLTGERGVNNVMLIGRLGRDPEVRGSETSPVTIFPLATSQSYRKPDGSYVQMTEWHRIVVFRPVLGQVVANTLNKGDKVYVTGSINYNRITDQETNKPVTIAQIKADDVIILKRRGDAENLRPTENMESLQEDQQTNTKPE